MTVAVARYLISINRYSGGLMEQESSIEAHMCTLAFFTRRGLTLKARDLKEDNLKVV